MFTTLLMTLLLQALPREGWPEGFHVERRERHVDLAASNVDALRLALARMRAEQGWHGATKGRIELGAELSPTANGCELRGLRTVVRLEVVLPRLTGAAVSSNDLRAAWSRIANGLSVHEEGHVAIAIDGALSAHRRLLEAPSFENCDDARWAVMREQMRVQATQDLAHERYDRRTRFGATQGAVLERRRMVVPRE